MVREASGDGTVGKALEVLDLVAEFGRPVRFTEVLEKASFPKATLYRFMQILTHQGMLAYDRNQQTYALGVRLVRLAHAAWKQSSLAPVARPHVDSLASDVGETVHLAQLDHAQVLYVDKRNPANAIEMYSSAGKVGPAYCTGVGKAMLAQLSEAELAPIIRQQSFHRFMPNTLVTADALRAELTEIRKRGYAFDREEHEPGIICVAAPVVTSEGGLLGALSVTSSTSRKTLEDLERLAPRIRCAAAAIAAEAQHWRFPDEIRQSERTGT